MLTRLKATQIYYLLFALNTDAEWDDFRPVLQAQRNAAYAQDREKEGVRRSHVRWTGMTLAIFCGLKKFPVFLVLPGHGRDVQEMGQFQVAC